ncbi:MAG: hypothetical protein RLZ35_1220 [Pseudomonadota bacterium]|jgi:6-phosphofructokinase 1
MIKNAFYAQSGGVTSVINASAQGVIETARQHPDKIGTVYAGLNGILGALHENLIDTASMSDKAVQALSQTPGGAFGSCRYKLKGLHEHQAEYTRLIDVFKAHNIGYFFYNGGGDSQDTAFKVSQMSQSMGYPIQCIGIPKTIDNDLPFTDTCPGFGSVAKYVAISTLEAGLDIASMAATSTKVFILEVMGRHAGWIAASSALAQGDSAQAPHLILLPEVIFNPERFQAAVKQHVETHGYCVVVASEGIKGSDGKFLSESGSKDAFGHAQLGGVAPVLSNMIQKQFGYKCHWAVSDYLQRAARHIASKVDVEQAHALGVAAVRFALAGKDAIMATIVRKTETPYTWEIGEVSLEKVANQEHKMPSHYIREDGFHITEDCLKYLRPLIQGEAYPTYTNGIPNYIRLDKTCINKKLPAFLSTR